MTIDLNLIKRQAFICYETLHKSSTLEHKF